MTPIIEKFHELLRDHDVTIEVAAIFTVATMVGEMHETLERIENLLESVITEDKGLRTLRTTDWR